MRRNLLTVWMLLAWLAMSFALPAARGQDDSDKSKKSARPDVSAEDRSQAISFASEHHPELARLLEQLEKPRPGEFARAIRELNGQIQRLEKLREKTPARYEEQLAAWKDESQIRVLLARWTRSRSPELESQIRELLARRHAARVARLQADQKRLESQLKKVGEELASIEDSTDAQVEKEWKVLQSKAAPVRKSADTSASGDAPASEPTESKKTNIEGQDSADTERP